MKIEQVDDKTLQLNKKYIVYFNYTGEFYGVDSFVELVGDLAPDYPAEDQTKDPTKQALSSELMTELARNFVQAYEFNAILAGTSKLTVKPTPANPLITLVSSVEYRNTAALSHQLVITSANWSNFMGNLTGLAQQVQAGAASSPSEYIVVLPVDKGNEEVFFGMLNLVGVVTIHDMAKVRKQPATK